MPFDRKEHNKKYYEKNKEKILSKQKEYDEKNREKIKEYQKEYYKQYYQTEKGKKGNRISNWKYNGVVHHNFDELYEKYINTEHCELCNIKLTEGKRTNTTRCLDHNHESGEFRNIICHYCNIRRG